VRQAKIKKRQNRSYWLFGAIAVVIHLALLLVPLRKALEIERPAVLELEIITMTKPAVDVEELPERLDEVSENEPPEQEPPRQLAQPLPALEELPEPTPEPAVTTTVLHQQVQELEIPEVKTPARKLGIAYVPPLPANLSKPVMEYEPTVFDELYAPIETEVLDQWQAADGSTMVVMRTPTGDTLCGRRAQWDPMNPLFEPVAMYSRCGGGGRRKHR
jgi:hypothetical protein